MSKPNKQLSMFIVICFHLIPRAAGFVFDETAEIAF